MTGTSKARTRKSRNSDSALGLAQGLIGQGVDGLIGKHADEFIRRLGGGGGVRRDRSAKPRDGGERDDLLS